MKDRRRRYAVGQYENPKYIRSERLDDFVREHRALTDKYGLVLKFDELTQRYCISRPLDEDLGFWVSNEVAETLE